MRKLFIRLNRRPYSVLEDFVESTLLYTAFVCCTVGREWFVFASLLYIAFISMLAFIWRDALLKRYAPC